MEAQTEITSLTRVKSRLEALILSTGLFRIPPKAEGAVERHIYNLIEGLRGNGIHVEVVGQSGDYTFRQQPGVKFHCLLKVPFKSETSFYGWLMNFLCGAILTTATVLTMRDRSKFDVVHGHDALSTLIAVSLRRVLFPNSAFVFTMHGYSKTFEDIRYRGTKRLVMLALVCLLRGVYQKADRLIMFTSDRLDKFTEFHHIPSDKVAVIPQVVSLTEDVPLHPVSFLRGPFCLFVGRLVKLKGVQDLIAAIHGTNIECLIVGSGPDERTLRDYASSLGLDKQVFFTGSLPHGVVTELYRRAYVAVHPSYAEGFPLVVLEALAVGSPVIAARTPGMAEVVKEGCNGLLYESGDVDTLRSLIVRLFEDTAQRDRLSKNAADWMRNRFDPMTVGRKTKEAYAIALDMDSSLAK